MASQSSDARALDPDRIAFDVERLTRQDDLVIVSGRWFGIRGRRFVRPTLIVVAGDSQQQILADLEHKPWAAHDGELWRAAFAVDGDPRAWDRIELSVAPDITVTVAPGQAPARAGRSSRGQDGVPGTPRRTEASPGQPSSIRARPERAHRPPGRSAGDLAYEIDRLKARLTAMEQAHQRERARREAADQALEEERAQSLGLRSDLGRTQAELDLTKTAERELAATLAELERARGQARRSGQQLQSARADAQDSGQRLESARSQADDVGRQLREAKTAAQHAERSLGSAQRALTEQRVENKRLREQLARGSAAPAAPVPAPAAATEAGGPGTAPKAQPAEPSAGPAPGQASVPEPVAGMEPPHRHEPGYRGERPVNPALSGINPTARMIAVCVVLAALVAVVLVIRTTL